MLGCAGLFLGCAGLCSGLFLGYSGLCSELFWVVLGCSELFLGCFWTGRVFHQGKTWENPFCLSSFVPLLCGIPSDPSLLAQAWGCLDGKTGELKFQTVPGSGISPFLLQWPSHSKHTPGHTWQGVKGHPAPFMCPHWQGAAPALSLHFTPPAVKCSNSPTPKKTLCQHKLRETL